MRHWPYRSRSAIATPPPSCPLRSSDAHQGTAPVVCCQGWRGSTIAIAGEGDPREAYRRREEEDEGFAKSPLLRGGSALMPPSIQTTLSCHYELKPHLSFAITVHFNIYTIISCCFIKAKDLYAFGCACLLLASCHQSSARSCTCPVHHAHSPCVLCHGQRTRHELLQPGQAKTVLSAVPWTRYYNIVGLGEG